MIDKKTIVKNIPLSIDKINYPKLGKKQSGKVRDWYIKNSLRVLIATDRISAFDKVLGLVPFRGAVLNKLSEFWFAKTRDICANHMIWTIDPNVMLVSECQALPVEVVVRGYITAPMKRTKPNTLSNADILSVAIKTLKLFLMYQSRTLPLCFLPKIGRAHV